MEDVRTTGFTAKDMFNSATAKSLKSLIGQTINVVDIWVTERADIDGVIKTVANLKTDKDEIYGTISDTVIRSVLALPEMLEESGKVAIKVEARPGKGGRDYLVITLA